jgi:NAD(P)-dependent dehydrogenase (short-subunit alcohol dehydrogenase family)
VGILIACQYSVTKGVYIMPNIFITGTNRGIGLALTKHFLNESFAVIATCRTPENATELRSLQSDYPDTLQIHPLDVANDKHIDNIAAVLQGLPIDVMINNAGVYGDRCSFGSVNYDSFEEVLRINTLAPLKIAEKLIHNLELGEQKKLVNITSKMGSIDDNTSGGRYSYRASKAALNAVTKSLAIDLAPEGISVAVIHPGWVRTDMGGSNATRSTEESASGIATVIENLSTKTSGKFFNFDGQEIAW